MHETSLVARILEQARRAWESDGGLTGGGERILAVEVEIGPLSGVEPDLLRLAYDRMAESAGLGGSRLIVVETPLRARCLICGDHYELAEFDFRCPRGCPGGLQVTQGDGCILRRLVVGAGEGTEAGS